MTNGKIERDEIMNPTMIFPPACWQMNFFAPGSSAFSARCSAAFDHPAISAEGTSSADFAFVVVLTSWEPVATPASGKRDTMRLQFSTQQIVIVPSECPWQYTGCRDLVGRADWS
jgi:hypothetical protein